MQALQGGTLAAATYQESVPRCIMLDLMAILQRQSRVALDATPVA